MHANVDFLTNFLNNNQPIAIPVYQRPYSWRVEDAIDLLEDIDAINIENEQDIKFIGSITYINTDQHRQLIDGQQRVTTLCLILTALRDLNLDTVELRNSINELLYIFRPAGQEIRLQLKPYDSAPYATLVNGGGGAVAEDRKIKINYEAIKNHICERVWTPNYSSTLLLKIRQRVQIVAVSIAQQDRPQEIFESLNNTGKKLTPIELVCNLIFMEMNVHHQNDLYTNCWAEVEKLLANESDSIGFLSNYLSIKTKDVTVVRDKIYEKYKRYFRGLVPRGIDTSRNAISDLRDCARRYIQIKNDATSPGVVRDLMRWRIETVTPLLMVLYEKVGTNQLTTEAFGKIGKIIESYILRRAVCELPSNSLGRIFCQAANLAEKVHDDASITEAIVNYLCNLNGKTRFPSNSEVIEKIIRYDLYAYRGCIEILTEILNHENPQYLIQVKNPTIEHIMPQTLTSLWQVELGPDFMKIHEQLLHTLGNLLLVPNDLNPGLGNRQYIGKRELLLGNIALETGARAPEFYTNTPFVTSVTNCIVWNRDSIEKRSRELGGVLLNKFPRPDSIQSESESDAENHAIENTIINKYTTNTEVISWYRDLEQIFVAHDLLPYGNANYVSFAKDGGVIVSARLQANGIKLVFNIPMNEEAERLIGKYQNSLRDVSNIGTGMMGNLEFSLRAGPHIEMMDNASEIVEDILECCNI